LEVFKNEAKVKSAINMWHFWKHPVRSDLAYTDTKGSSVADGNSCKNYYSQRTENHTLYVLKAVE